MKLIGKAIDQKQIGEDGSHRVGCRTAMWKGMGNKSMISKQHNESILSIRTNIRSSHKPKYLKVCKQLHVGA